MSLKNKFFSVAAVGVATVALSAFTFAQDTKTTTTPDKADKAATGRRGDFGKRGQFGRHGDFDKRGMGHRGGFMGGRGGGMGLLRGANLTDAQKEQIKSLMQANKPDQALRDELKTIAQARRDGTITDAQKARLKAIHEQMAASRKALHEQVLAILTPEQKAAIEQRRNEMKQRREQWQQKREEFRKNHPVDTKTAPAPAVKPSN
jgi:Spy/CpxP family protein refolding chaperone